MNYERMFATQLILKICVEICRDFEKSEGIELHNSLEAIIKTLDIYIYEYDDFDDLYPISSSRFLGIYKSFLK